MTETIEIAIKFHELRSFVDREIHPRVSPDEWNIYCELRGLVDTLEEEVTKLYNDNADLKPCPFCGSHVFLEKIPMLHYRGCYTYEIKCKNPDCGCEIRLGGNDTVYQNESEARENAIKAWNKRS